MCTISKSLAVAAAGDEVAVPVLADGAVAYALVLAPDAVGAPGTRAFASGAVEARPAHAAAVLRVALAAVSAVIRASLIAVGAELARLTRPVASDVIPSCQK